MSRPPPQPPQNLQGGDLVPGFPKASRRFCSPARLRLHRRKLGGAVEKHEWAASGSDPEPAWSVPRAG